MEENEMMEEMDVVATELLAVQGDVLTSNEAMKAEIIASLSDVVKEVQDSNFDTQQSIDELKKLFKEPCVCDAAPAASVPDGSLAKAVAELKEKLEKQEKMTTICAVAAVIAAVASFIGLFL